MEPTILFAAVLALLGYTAGSIKIINEGEEALVQRLGRYHRTLRPGMNFVVPGLDTVYKDSTREQILDIPPQSTITKDRATVEVDAIVYWKVLDIYRAYYAVEDLEESLKNLVITTIRSEVGQLSLEELISGQDSINRGVREALDSPAKDDPNEEPPTERWGIKVTRVEVQRIEISEELRRARDQELAAQSRRKATLADSQAQVESIQIIAQALNNVGDMPNAQVTGQSMLQYLVARSYIDANQRLSASNNSKIIFMDPKALSESVSELVAADTNEGLNMGISDGDVPKS